MFRDRSEELKKLEEALLEEEVPEEDGEPDWEADQEPEIRNFANGYGTPEAWNSDDMDGDLEEYSREVYESGNSRRLRLLGFAALLLIIAAILGWMVLKQRGMLP